MAAVVGSALGQQKLNHRPVTVHRCVMQTSDERRIRGNKCFQLLHVTGAHSLDCRVKFRVHKVSLLNDHEHRYNRHIWYPRTR